jgi:hypothetical protein
MRFVFLDSGPLGLLTNPRGRSKADRCRQWSNDLAAAGYGYFSRRSPTIEVRAR